MSYLMLIKEKDKNQEQVDYLSELLERELPEDKKQLIERELGCINFGDKGEKSSSYYLDFDFKNSKNWAVIHDLRIEHKGNVAQIDHLVIGRMMDIYVIESKNFNSGVAISDEGDFSYFYKDRPYAISSPISQNERRIRLLDSFLSDNNLYPKRLGVSLRPSFRNIVLISPATKLTKPKKGMFDSSAVMKSDRFLSYFKDSLNDDPVNSLISITKVISSDSLRSFAEKLAILHEPKAIDYQAKFGIENKTQSDSTAEPEEAYLEDSPDCPKCGKSMLKRVSKKGKNIGKPFWGCSDYPKCKGLLEFDVEPDVDTVQNEIIEADSPECPQCHKPMIKRVSKKGSSKGNEFWGCSGFPKCKSTLQIESTETEELITDVKSQEDIPLCPKCNEPMVKRSAKKGDTAGKEFWGCSKFPKCRGIVSID